MKDFCISFARTKVRTYMYADGMGAYAITNVSSFYQKGSMQKNTEIPERKQMKQLETTSDRDFEVI